MGNCVGGVSQYSLWGGFEFSLLIIRFWFSVSPALLLMLYNMATYYTSGLGLSPPGWLFDNNIVPQVVGFIIVLDIFWTRMVIGGE